MAREYLPAFAWEYIDGGAEDEITLAANRAAFSAWRWHPRSMVDVSHVETEKVVLGHTCNMPLAIGPTGYNGLLRRGADVALARAAGKAGVPFTLSTVSCASIEDIVKSTTGNVWFQLYCFRDEGITNDLLARALAAGVDTLVITTDAMVLGRREWDARCYRKPRHLAPRYVLDALCHPGWVMQTIWPNGLPKLGNLREYLPKSDQSAAGAVSFIARQLLPEFGWSHIDRLRNRWRGKLVIKGILTAEEAVAAARHGADGIVVSNHGGRQLDGAVATLSALPEIVTAVQGKLTILLDGGVRRGGDIAKALALGADAALVGRATLYGVAAGGTSGASKALDILAQQLQTTLALVGCADVSDLSRYGLRGMHDAAARITASRLDCTGRLSS